MKLVHLQTSISVLLWKELNSSNDILFPIPQQMSANGVSVILVPLDVVISKLARIFLQAFVFH